MILQFAVCFLFGMIAGALLTIWIFVSGMK